MEKKKTLEMLQKHSRMFKFYFVKGQRDSYE